MVCYTSKKGCPEALGPLVCSANPFFSSLNNLSPIILVPTLLLARDNLLVLSWFVVGCRAVYEAMGSCVKWGSAKLLGWRFTHHCSSVERVSSFWKTLLFCNLLNASKGDGNSKVTVATVDWLDARGTVDTVDQVCQLCQLWPCFFQYGHSARIDLYSNDQPMSGSGQALINPFTWPWLWLW